MGTRERRQRQFDERETLIIRAAAQAIREHGLLNLQMSRIAEKCEYAVGTLYQHFASKEDLLLALTTESTREHVDMFHRATQWPGTPRERLFAVGVADMIFVQRHPDYFRIAQYSLCEVVWRAASEQRREAYLACSAEIGDIVVGIINEAVAAGDLDLQGLPPQQLALACWALAEGTHNLVHTEGMLRDFDVDDPYLLMCRHMQTLLNGFGWKPLANVEDRQALTDLIHRIQQEAFKEFL